MTALLALAAVALSFLFGQKELLQQAGLDVEQQQAEILKPSLGLPDSPKVVEPFKAPETYTGAGILTPPPTYKAVAEYLPVTEEWRVEILGGNIYLGTIQDIMLITGLKETDIYKRTWI